MPGSKSGRVEGVLFATQFVKIGARRELLFRALTSLVDSQELQK
jgi:hypothetical protein